VTVGWAAAALALGALALAGCGDGETGPGTPPSDFERALASVGEGVSPSASGFGWLDLKRLGNRPPRERDRLALALGPGADDLLRRPVATARALGSDPRDAKDAVSISGSYALGVRLRGISGARLAERLRGAGARERREGEWRLYNLGGWAESRVRGPLAALGPYVSRVAVAPRAIVLTRFAPARSALIGGGESSLSDPALGLAVSCLGRTEAARTLPGAFTHNKATSPDLLAIGRLPGGTEAICAIGDSTEAATAHADAIEGALDPGARDGVTGQPIARLVGDVSVETLARGGIGAARATLAPARGPTAGFVFGALVRGSLLTYTGSAPPISGGAARRARRSGSG
jgi:hypothetical protein